MKTAVKRFFGDDRGLTLVEYVAGGALVALFLFGTLNAIFSQAKASATATNAEMTSKIPTAPQ
ncbi:MAG: hypothetical protein EPO21_03930 [Chloroflexota bacterium]|nr:MAG: hypothetical protein EPO21_03930 [Chloroflexota bacterium]